MKIDLEKALDFKTDQKIKDNILENQASRITVNQDQIIMMTEGIFIRNSLDKAKIQILVPVAATQSI
jgi:hypothetical protein